MNMKIFEATEQARNGTGTILARVWFGGKTLRPAAQTGRQLDLEKLPTSVIDSADVAVPWLAMVIRCGEGLTNLAV